MAEYAYFTEGTSEQFSFFRIPKILAIADEFMDLSAEAKFLYGVLLDRTGLSRRNGWVDEAGHVYIIFTVREMIAVTRKSKNCVFRMLDELERIGLLERRRQGCNRPNRLYLKNFSKRIASEEGYSNDRGSSGKTVLVGNCPETPSEAPPEALQKELRKSQTRNSGSPSQVLPEVLQKDVNNTDNNKTDCNDTEWRESLGSPQAEEGEMMYGRFENVRLTKNEVEILKEDYPSDWITWIDRLSGYMASSGKQYKDHFATICLWADREKRPQEKVHYEDSEGFYL